MGRITLVASHDIMDALDPQPYEVDVLGRLREMYETEQRRVWAAYLAAGKHNDVPPVNEDR